LTTPLLTILDDRHTFSPNLVHGEFVPRDTSDLLHGTLDLLVLKALATQPLHGFGLSKWIEDRTRNELEIVDSALYKALHRLEDNGAIVAEWGVSENNRKAKYYSLTSRGRQQLRAETATWKRYVAAISGVIETA
jgi:transcriptional regulator